MVTKVYRTGAGLFLMCLVFTVVTGCLSSGSNTVSTLYGPILTTEGVFVVKSEETTSSVQSGQSQIVYSWYIGQFDFKGRLDTYSDLTPILGSSRGLCHIRCGRDTLLLIEFENYTGIDYLIYNSHSAKVTPLSIEIGDLHFAFDTSGEALWHFRHRYNSTLQRYFTNFDKIDLTSFDTVQSLEKEGYWHCSNSVWKRGNELLCSRGDSLIALNLTTGEEVWLDIPFEDFTSFGNDGIVTVDREYTLYVQTKENVNYDTLFTFPTNGSFSSVSLSDDGEFMAYKAFKGYSYIGLYDREANEISELYF